MDDRRSTIHRWLEAIGQNLAAAALWLAAIAALGALSLWLATEGADVVKVRVWWIAAALLSVVVIGVWLAALTVRLGKLQRAVEAGPGERKGSVSTSRPNQNLLERIDSLVDQLRARSGDQAVEWELGELYNGILAEVQRLPHTPGIGSVRTATRSPTALQRTAQSASALAAGLAHLRSVVAAGAVASPMTSPSRFSRG